MSIVVEATALLIVAAIIALLAVNWNALPARHPIHFGFTGEPDAWGPKGMALLWPVLALGLYLLLTGMPYAVAHGYLPPKPGTDIPRVAALLGWIKIEVLALVLYIEWAAIETAVGRERGPHIAVLSGFVLAVVGTVVLSTRQVH